MCNPAHLKCNQRRRRLDLKSLRLPKFPTSFHGSPCTNQTQFHESPQILIQVFTCVNGVPVIQKIERGNRWIFRFKYLKSDLFHEWYCIIRLCDHVVKLVSLYLSLSFSLSLYSCDLGCLLTCNPTHHRVSSYIVSLYDHIIKTLYCFLAISKKLARKMAKMHFCYG